MEASFNTEHKIFIRENWNKPLLKFLTKRVNDRLIYLGLPSPKAEDILQWIEYIKFVIAFQCRDYKETSDNAQDRTGILELTALLSQLETENRIESFVVFDGWLEEVVLRGFDNSPTRIDFELTDFITLYNLDFCNKITSPIEFVNAVGDIQTAYKFDAITKLLEIQKSFGAVSKKFVLFLTVHCSYDGEELQNFIDHPPNNEIRDYIQKCNGLKGYEKNARIVRLFFAYSIKQNFEVFGFTPKVLPSLIYQGLGDTSLLHFTVLGITPTTTVAGRVPTYQSLTDILNQRFISIKNAQFMNREDALGSELEVELNPVALFSNSETFKKLWVA